MAWNTPRFADGRLPKKDLNQTNARHMGMEDFIANRSMDPSRHNINDSVRAGMYNTGWVEESIHFMEVVPGRA